MTQKDEYWHIQNVFGVSFSGFDPEDPDFVPKEGFPLADIDFGEFEKWFGHDCNMLVQKQSKGGGGQHNIVFVSRWFLGIVFQKNKIVKNHNKG